MPSTSEHPDAPAATATGHAVDDTRNQLLLRMPADERARLLPHLEPFTLEPMQVLAEPDAPIPHVYFPEGGIISLLRGMADGSLIESGTVGLEGMAGLPLALDVDWSLGTIAGQIPGPSRRMDAGAFRALLPELPGLQALLRRYTAFLLTQTAQSVACNGFHSIEQRCARWLLMTHDRVPGDEFVLTHEVLAQMLAVRRAGVTEAAGALQRAGYIAYSRGRVRIRDRAGLEGAACECYGQVRAHLERLLGPDGE